MEQRVPAIAYAGQMFRDGLRIKEESRSVEEVVQEEQAQEQENEAE